VELISTPAPYWFPAEWYELADARHFWLEWRLAALLRQLVRVGLRRDRRLRVLDIGGGTGVVRQQLEACSEWTIDVTDLHPSALRNTRPGRGRNLCYDVREARPQFLDAYDAVILFDVLEHIEPTLPFLAAAARHLRPGGHMLVNVPALGWLFSAYDRAAGHLRRYDRASLCAETTGTGLVVVDLAYWGLLMVPLLLARRLALSGSASPSEIIRRGFSPPGRLAHGLLRSLMRVELSSWPRPPLGTSLLMATERRS
jgi:SAM-dependent methyltransferase